MARKTHAMNAILVFTFWLFLLGTAHAERLYKWKDENGVVRYGDSIPPQYSKQQVQILNKHGVAVGQIDAAKTPEQIAEEKRQREREEAVRQEVAIRKQHDKNLLDTYGSVDEIELERKRQVSAVDAQITQANRQIRLLQSKVARLEIEAQSYEKSADGTGPSIPQTMIREMDETRLALDEYEAQLRGFYVSQADLRLKFDGDTVRFRELKRARR